jgi:hypothetical protein
MVFSAFLKQMSTLSTSVLCFAILETALTLRNWCFYTWNSQKLEVFAYRFVKKLASRPHIDSVVL